MKNDNTHAEAQSEYPLTFEDLSPEGKAAAKMLLPLALRKGILLLGRAGAGKTPLSYILGMMVSRHHRIQTGEDFDYDQWESFVKIQGTVRITNDLGFMKDESGSKVMPFILDDPDLSDLQAKTLKCFFDMQQKEGIAKARWTGTKSVHGPAVHLDGQQVGPAQRAAHGRLWPAASPRHWLRRHLRRRNAAHDCPRLPQGLHARRHQVHPEEGLRRRELRGISLRSARWST